MNQPIHDHGKTEDSGELGGGTTSGVDFGRAALDYATHRAGFTPRFFEELANRFDFGGRRALDIGAGTGSLARGFAQRGAMTTALDPSQPLLEQASRLARLERVRLHCVHGRAESLPFADDQFDLVSAGQCWHWLDRRRAASEVARVLRPKGAAVIAHFDWIASHPVVEESLTIIDRFASVPPNWESFSESGLYPMWLSDLRAAGLVGQETFSFVEQVPYTLEDWVGRLRASARVGGTLSQLDVAEVSRELTRGLCAAFRGEPVSIPHRTWAVIGCASI